MGINTTKTLVAGPWVGEFGWEIMSWVPYLRYIAESGEYDKIIIASRKHSEYLYKDFCSKFIVYDSNDQNCSYSGTGSIVDTAKKKKEREAIAKDIFKGEDWDKLIVPFKDDFVNKPKSFSPYGTYSSDLSYDVVVHARNIWDVDGALSSKKSRNWKKEKWNKIGELFKQYNLKTCSIGTKSGALHVPYSDDKRGERLSTVANILASSKLCIGASSGPIHFASLCKCTHLVWTQKSNYSRYKKAWNPFGTKANVITNGASNGWNPAVSSVIKGVLSELNIKDINMIKDIIPDPCNLLIFSNDDDNFDLSCKKQNKSGNTTIVKNKTMKIASLGDYLYLDSKTRKHQWFDLLGRDEELMLDIPESKRDVDIIIVNGPISDSKDNPSKMKSIYTASILAKNSNKNVTVVICDYDELVEKVYSLVYLGSPSEMMGGMAIFKFKGIAV